MTTHFFYFFFSVVNFDQLIDATIKACGGGWFRPEDGSSTVLAKSKITSSVRIY